ncbi:MAG: hypothetical protein GTO24_00290 [candidate division Zixibacteria bacterium]|nr:hypothetical protein [candidate division Zixibacteria bacterium]
MSYLILCSFEVGGLPYRMAEVLNRHGVETYYVSLAGQTFGHDSTLFHYGSRSERWDVSPLFNDSSSSTRETVSRLRQIRRDYRVSRALAAGSKAYLLKLAGIRYNYWSFGSDLDQSAFHPIWSADYPVWKKPIYYGYFCLTTRSQFRMSIRQADLVMVAPYQIEKLRMICPGKSLFFLPHFDRIDDYESLKRRKCQSRVSMSHEIQAEKYLFSSARHCWAGKNRHKADNKGNDIILRSFGTYLEKTGDCDLKLVLVKKGPDLERSMGLVQSLGIDEYVVWLNEMSRGELARYYQGAVMCLGQFGTPVLTYAAVEPLFNGSCCVSFFQDMPVGVPFYEAMPPVINTKDPGEVVESIGKIMSDRKYREELGYRSWVWARKNCSEQDFVDSFMRAFA